MARDGKNRPAVELEDIVRATGQGFIERNCRWINGQHRKVLQAITYSRMWVAKLDRRCAGRRNESETAVHINPVRCTRR